MAIRDLATERDRLTVTSWILVLHTPHVTKTDEAVAYGTCVVWTTTVTSIIPRNNNVLGCCSRMMSASRLKLVLSDGPVSRVGIHRGFGMISMLKHICQMLGSWLAIWH
jgi:hypothetical protein